MTAETFVNLTISGITLGAVYLLMALGLSLVYGVTRVLNYAQGSIFSWGGYIAWYLSAGGMDLSYAVVIPITVVTMFIAGVLFEKAVVLPVRRFKDWEFTIIIITLGCALLLDNLLLTTFGPLSKTIPHIQEGTYHVGNFVISKHNVIMLLTSVIILVALWFFLEQTRIGMALQAVSQDGMGAKIVGLPVNNLYSLSFGIAGVFAAIAAILLAPRTLLYPLVGWTTMLKALVILVFGGFGSIKGTVVASVFLALIEVFASYLFGGMWAMPIFLALLIITLAIRPKGLFGTW